MSEKNKYPSKFIEGYSLYHEGKFWESHESWEILWRNAQGVDRDFYQGLIQLDAALLHTRKQHWTGVANLLRRSLSHLEKCPSRYLGLDVSSLQKALRLYLAKVENLRNGNGEEFDWSLQPALKLEGH